MRQLVPPLASDRHKGQAGKIGVVGGCFEYTGAPFYAAISALKLGADLSHIFCDVDAATPIKSYSPELIVHGCMRAGESGDIACERQADAISKWFPALTGIVVGPGLGRDPTLQSVAALVIRRAVAAELPCVIDADGLRLVIEDPQLVQGSVWTVLTPNKPEYERLCALLTEPAPAAASAGNGEGAQSGEEAEESAESQLMRLSAALGGVCIVRKGPSDLITDGHSVVANSEIGSLKRSGGQGDVLSGTLATMLSWAKQSHSTSSPSSSSSSSLSSISPGHSRPLLAAYTGCFLNRRFSKAAFARHRRSMTAPDLIDAIGCVMEEFAPCEQD